MPDEKSSDIGDTANYKEGSHIITYNDGTVHETKWYSNDYGSYRSSSDYDKDGNTSNEHTKKNR